jgi:ribosomal small subunit protein bTHX
MRKKIPIFVLSSINNQIINHMGKGDKKSRRGKIHIGSSGVRRHKHKTSRKPAPAVVKAEEPVKKPKAKAAEKPKPAEVEVAEAPVVEAAAVETAPKPAAKKKAPAKSTPKKAKPEDKPAE